MATDYFSHLRKDALDVIPNNCKTVLSIGCGAGFTEKELIKAGISVYAVEYDQAAAAIAKSHGIEVISGDAESIDVGIFNTKFDMIIYCDILEHLRNPGELLNKHCQHLSDSGSVYISVPNFRHYTIFIDLFLKGEIKYKDAGILDRTHIRITTRKMVESWIQKAGLISQNTQYLMYWRRHKLMNLLTLGLAKELFAVQIGITAKK